MLKAIFSEDDPENQNFMKMSIQKAPSLLDKLASLTTIRDIELFEISLLKTMAELLKIKQLSMYKINPLNKNCWLIVYANDYKEYDNKRCFSESQEIYTSEITIPEHIEFAQIWIKTTGKPYIKKQDSNFLIVYPVANSHQIISLISFELTHSLSENEMLIITSLLSITQNFQALLDENQKDKLTGLLNRHSFEENINKIQSLSLHSQMRCHKEWNGNDKRKNKALVKQYCLAIIDIDNFKCINDHFGHIMGDEVLLLLSYIMKQSFRPKDLLFRFGGEEFVVIFSIQHKDEARVVLERFREMIGDYHFPQISKVTVSIGATFIHKEILLVSEIVVRADKALYYAKNHGKDQLHFYEDLRDNGLIIERKETGTIDFF